MVVNGLSFDVEDYFQVSAFEHVVDRSTWSGWECRVEKNMETILEILICHGVQATFFILGWIAARYPALVKKIHDSGHEIANHGYEHHLVYSMTPASFRRDVDTTTKLLEDLTGEKVLGFRAASFSIVERTPWAFEILRDLGLQYDSSVFPIHHDRSGIPGAPRNIFLLDNGLVEIPLSTVRLCQLNIPAAGGGYFRLYPYRLTRWLIKKINREGNPAIVYLHPWEFDPEQPRIRGVKRLTLFRHHVNIKKTRVRLNKLLADFNFCRLKDLLHLTRPL